MLRKFPMNLARRALRLSTKRWRRLTGYITCQEDSFFVEPLRGHVRHTLQGQYVPWGEA
jgi:hypothetical protein